MDQVIFEVLAIQSRVKYIVQFGIRNLVVEKFFFGNATYQVPLEERYPKTISPPKNQTNHKAYDFIRWILDD